MSKGIIRKLKSKNLPNVEYSLPLGDELVELNPLIGRDIEIKHTGDKYCIDTGKKLKQTYGQGYSWESYITLAECDQCIFQPELCHYSKGTCRDEAWGEANCMQPHVIYLSVTSDMKIGITRKKNVPTRWVDQGAHAAIKVMEVKNRLTSGLIEVEIAKSISDKTNWRNMLKNVHPEVDLKKEKKRILKEFAPIIEKYEVEVLDDEITEIEYPVETYPSKVSSLNFDKNPVITSKLVGIKGQYLIFESGVINMRKFQGYEIEIKS